MNTCDPEEVGLSGPRLERIQAGLQRLVDAKLAPGFAWAVARRGKLACHGCLGWADVDARQSLAPDSLYRIYSMTKAIATSALMMLYEEGKVLLQTPVSDYMPGFKELKVYTGLEGGKQRFESMRREITLLDLAIHTSGLGYGLFTDSPVEDMYREAGILDHKLVFQVSLDEFIKHLQHLPLANQPGARWRYSMGIDVIGYLVQLISGIPFDQFLKERIFNPLGMADTGFYVPPEKVDRLAALYEPGAKGRIICIDPAHNSPFINPAAVASGGAGLISSLQDYLAFTQCMLNGGELDGTRILGRKTVEKMRRNHLPVSLLPVNIDGFNTPGLGFGPGFGVNLNEAESGFTASEGTFYWGGAASTAFFIDPKEELTGVMMTQVINNPLPFDQVFRQLVYQALAD